MYIYIFIYIYLYIFIQNYIHICVSLHAHTYMYIQIFMLPSFPVFHSRMYNIHMYQIQLYIQYVDIANPKEIEQ